MEMSKERSLAKVCKDLMLQNPFYGIYLLMLDKKWSNRIPTAGVCKLGINYRIIINENFWNSLLHEWRVGIIHHECLHLCFFHLLRHAEFENQDIANIAMDCEINQYIPGKNLPAFDLSKEDFDITWKPFTKSLADDLKSGKITIEESRIEIRKVPPRGVYIKDFPELNLEPKMGTRYYYDKFIEGKKEKDKTGTSGCPALDDMLDGIGAGTDMVFDHDWSEFDALSETEKKLLGSQIDFHLREIAAQMKSRGTIPGEMKEYIDSLFEIKPPKFDWKGYLRRFIGGSTKVYTKKLQRKINKRFEEEAGLKIKQKKHLLVGVDTSGSVGDDELVEFINEIHHIFKTGTDVTLCQFDAAIQTIGAFNPKQEILISGRGGTDFSPIIEYANANTRKYTCVIIFTDGEAPAPEKTKVPCLWVHSSESEINESLEGYKIKLEM